jgi:hypothetical protein
MRSPHNKFVIRRGSRGVGALPSVDPRFEAVWGPGQLPGAKAASLRELPKLLRTSLSTFREGVEKYQDLNWFERGFSEWSKFADSVARDLDNIKAYVAIDAELIQYRMAALNEWLAANKPADAEDAAAVQKGVDAELEAVKEFQDAVTGIVSDAEALGEELDDARPGVVARALASVVSGIAKTTEFVALGTVKFVNAVGDLSGELAKNALKAPKAAAEGILGSLPLLIVVVIGGFVAYKVFVSPHRA